MNKSYLYTSALSAYYTFQLICLIIHVFSSKNVLFLGLKQMKESNKKFILVPRVFYHILMRETSQTGRDLSENWCFLFFFRITLLKKHKREKTAALSMVLKSITLSASIPDGQISLQISSFSRDFCLRPGPDNVSSAPGDSGYISRWMLREIITVVISR